MAWSLIVNEEDSRYHTLLRTLSAALYLLLLRLLHQPPLSPCADLLGTDGRNNRHSKRGGEDLWKRTGDSMVEE